MTNQKKIPSVHSHNYVLTFYLFTFYSSQNYKTVLTISEFKYFQILTFSDMALSYFASKTEA